MFHFLEFYPLLRYDQKTYLLLVAVIFPELTFCFFFQKKAPELLESGDYTIPDLCFSLQETIFAMLVEITGQLLNLSVSLFCDYCNIDRNVFNC